MPRRKKDLNPLVIRLGQRLHALRKERKRSLEEMLSGAGFLGTGYLLRVERGPLLPSIPTLEKIARALEVELIDVVNRPEESLRHRLLELTRHLSQEALTELVEHAERLRDKENPPR
jgi:transcriptional regulator with XRE-family HTH domain